MEEISIDTKIDALIRGVKKVLDKIEDSRRVVLKRSASTDFYSPRGGQLQFSIGHPKWAAPTEKDGVYTCHMEREGAVFIEGAPPDPQVEGKLDWKNKKIVFALSDKDIAAVVDGLESGVVDKNGFLVNLTHAVGESIKTFKIKPGTADRDGRMTYLLELSDQVAKNRVSLFVSKTDTVRLRLALTSAMGPILGWMN